MSKNTILIILCSLFSYVIFAQEAAVEKSIFGIQTGFLGIWVHHEAKLSNTLVLRSELGFDSGIWDGSYYDKTGFLMTPVLSLEPRWYYNLAKREQKEKRIDGNSGNFLSLKTSYHPDWFVISNQDQVKVISDLSIIPKWGIRRNIGNHFNFETGLGIGYHYIFAKQGDFAQK